MEFIEIATKTRETSKQMQSCNEASDSEQEDHHTAGQLHYKARTSEGFFAIQSGEFQYVTTWRLTRGGEEPKARNAGRCSLPSLSKQPQFKSFSEN